MPLCDDNDYVEYDGDINDDDDIDDVETSKQDSCSDEEQEPDGDCSALVAELAAAHVEDRHLQGAGRSLSVVAVMSVVSVMSVVAVMSIVEVMCQ